MKVNKSLMAMFAKLIIGLLIVGCGRNLPTRSSADQQIISKQQAQIEMLEAQAKIQQQKQTTAPAASNATPAAQPAPPVVQQEVVKEIVRVPAVAPVIPGSRIVPIGFDISMDPCKGDYYRQALASMRPNIAWEQALIPGGIRRTSKNLKGYCAAVQDIDVAPSAWILPEIDGVVLITRYAPDVVNGIAVGMPQSVMALDWNGNIQPMAITPPGRTTTWLMPAGRHNVRYHVFRESPTDDYLVEYEGTVNAGMKDFPVYGGTRRFQPSPQRYYGYPQRHQLQSQLNPSLNELFATLFGSTLEEASLLPPT